MKKSQIIFYLLALTVFLLSSCNGNKQKNTADKPDLKNPLSNSIDSLSPCWSKLADLKTPRNTHMVAIVNNKIYVAGGGTSGGSFEEYDLATNTWKSKADMPTPREFISGCAINGKIYAIGGWLNNKTNAIVEEYDPTTNSWTSKSHMPTRRWGHSTVVMNGKIYIIGGALDWPISEYYTSIEIYNPETDTWTTKAGHPDAGIAPRWGFSTCISNGKIYAIGGIDAKKYPDKGNTFQAMTIVEEYDPELNTWIRKSSMPTARWCLATVTVNNNIYAIGGGDTYYPEEMLNTVEAYDPLTDTWVTKSPMPKGRIAIAACTLNNKIYIPSGGGLAPTDVYPDFFVYDPACDTRE